MTRIVAGSAKGRRLATPSGANTRPTSERVREAIFSRLEHLDALGGAAVLDLYAGSGALGLEAMSRGAARALLVESARPVAAVARRNAADLGWGEAVCVRADPVERVLAQAPPHPYDLLLLDPPYDLAEATLGGVLEAVLAHDWVRAAAVVVLERSARSPEPPWPRGVLATAEKEYGETRVWYAEVARGPYDDRG